MNRLRFEKGIAVNLVLLLAVWRGQIRSCKWPEPRGLCRVSASCGCFAWRPCRPGEWTHPSPDNTAQTRGHLRPAAAVSGPDNECYIQPDTFIGTFININNCQLELKRPWLACALQFNLAKSFWDGFCLKNYFAYIYNKLIDNVWCWMLTYLFKASDRRIMLATHTFRRSCKSAGDGVEPCPFVLPKIFCIHNRNILCTLKVSVLE